jgi:hypothetical protein
MRYASIVIGGFLLSAALFTSCTCHKDISSAPPLTYNVPTAGPVSWITPRGPIARATPLAPVTPQEMTAANPTPANMPDDFPPDVPIYKDASLADVQSLANDAHNVIFRTGDTIPNVFQFYETQMNKNGWQVTQRVQRSTHAFLSFRKGDMVANLTIAQDVQNAGKQVIAIMYEHEKPLDFEEF